MMGRPRTCEHPSSSWVTRSDGHGVRCRDCHNERSRIARRTPQRKRYMQEWHLLNKYGITLEHAEELFARFDGKCWLCRNTEARHIDHDHDTQRVRGVICINCNTGLHTIDKLGIDTVAGYLNGLDVTYDGEGE